MNFVKLLPQHQEQINSVLQRLDSKSSDYSVAGLMLWTEFLSPSIAFVDDIVFIKGTLANERVFLSPLCKNEKFTTALELLKKYAKEHNYPLKVILAEDSQIKSLDSSLSFDCESDISGNANGYCYTSVRNMAEYLYSPSDLINLTGKRYHSKRNHIAQFKTQYDNRYELREAKITDIDGITSLLKSWAESKGYDYLDELRRIKTVLEKHSVLQVKILLLIIDKAVTGMSIIQKTVNNIGLVLFEKCDSNHPLGFAILNQFAAMQLSDTIVINRQEDIGFEGLRRAKMSYHPIELYKKYVVTEDIIDKLIALYQEVFGDNSKLCDVIFKDICPCGGAFAELDNSVVVACGFVRKRIISILGQTYPMPFIMGIATKESHRNKGLATNIMKKIIASLSKAGAPVATLLPFNHKFYQKYDFVTISQMTPCSVTQLNLPNYKYTPLEKSHAQLMVDLYSKYCMPYKISESRNEDDMITKLAEISAMGGKSYLILNKETDVIGYMLIDENKAVKEIILTSALDYKITDNTVSFDKIEIIGDLLIPNQGEKSENYAMARVLDPIILITSISHLITALPPFSINIHYVDSILGNKHFMLKCDEELTISYDIDSSIPTIDLSATDLIKWAFLGKSIDHLPTLKKLPSCFYSEY